jgi:hypothetical protein
VEEVKNKNNEKLTPSNGTNIKKHKQLVGGQQTHTDRRILWDWELRGIMKRPSLNVVVCPTI